MNAFASALVVDDLPHCRSWVAQALAQAFPGIVIGMADTVEGGLRGVAAKPPLALIDLGLPDGSGLQIIEALKRDVPDCVTVVSTVFDDDAHLFPALRAGAQGYVLKDEPIESLATMLTGIVSGQPPLSPSIARRLLRHFQPLGSTPTGSNDSELTARETEVLRLIAKGFTVPQVADTLTLTRNTVAGYLKDIYRKLRVSTRAEATLEAARRGLVHSDTF
jgi:DNA-binding NarL/FixJ family response regulator